MQKTSSSLESASLSTHELLILHTAEAQEWASYLQHILKSSRKFRKRSILLYAVGPADQLHGYNFDYFHSCKCIVLLLTGAFMDMLYEPELQGALQRLLHPPHRVVALLCGVSEDDILMDSFEDWPLWRKLSAEDAPAVYVTTILESIHNSGHAERERESAATEELHTAAATSTESPARGETEGVLSEEQKETVEEDDKPASVQISETEDTQSSSHLTCLTVQPKRVLCGEEESIFIILTHKVDDQSLPEVEFSSENVAPKRVPGTVENEYTIRVTAPDMPAGVVSLTMYTEQSSIRLKSVTYYTHMGEVGQCLETATDPINFICQAFNLTSNSTESLDNLLTDSLKSRMPATGLQLFGIRQIEEDNMAAYQRNEELPTLLHFAAKYGLKKLTTTLLQSPGALQAYSVMNKDGDYPNTLAERSGFSDLRDFMDEFLETADLLKSHLEGSGNTEEGAEVYELMTAQDIMMKYSGCPEDIYEYMTGINPECAEDLYEVMNAVTDNPEEAMLRTFFQGKPHNPENNKEQLQSEHEEHVDQTEPDHIEKEEDPYNLCPEDIYDTVDESATYHSPILYRPPAPIPRPETEPEPERCVTYISRVFSDKSISQSQAVEPACPAAAPEVEPSTPVHDPFAGMKTPGQRQLITLQERVKVGEMTVDEAVQEFKAWQIDHELRANSIRYQQENLKRLRESINRRHKEREKAGKDLDFEISAPMQRNLYWGSNVTYECAVYESTPRAVAPSSTNAQPIQRGNWKTGSTSSTSSTESNRLSTHSSFSCSSGTEPDLEETSETLPPPPPPRPSDAAPFSPPPRIPPRIPQRGQEKMLHERYVSYPTRALPERPTRQTNLAPTVPRRLR